MSKIRPITANKKKKSNSSASGTFQLKPAKKKLTKNEIKNPLNILQQVDEKRKYKNRPQSSSPNKVPFQERIRKTSNGDIVLSDVVSSSQGNAPQQLNQPRTKQKLSQHRGKQRRNKTTGPHTRGSSQIDGPKPKQLRQDLFELLKLFDYLGGQGPVKRK